MALRGSRVGPYELSLEASRVPPEPPQCYGTVDVTSPRLELTPLCVKAACAMCRVRKRTGDSGMIISIYQFNFFLVVINDKTTDGLISLSGGKSTQIEELCLKPTKIGFGNV